MKFQKTIKMLLNEQTAGVIYSIMNQNKLLSKQMSTDSEGETE